MNMIDRISIRRGDTLLKALSAIDRGGLGLCLECEPNGDFSGILTDGDVRRALISGAMLEHDVHPFVNTSPVVVTPADDRVFVLDLIQARGFTAVPVIESGRVVAIHSLRSLTGRESRPVTAVIMAGGRGTRLGALTAQTPKPMLHVGGRPILERLVIQLVGDGISRIFLAVNYLGDVIQDHFKDGSQHGAFIDYLVEDDDRPLGTAGALGMLASHALDPEHSLLVLNGDLVTSSSLGGIADRHRRSGAELTIGTTVHRHQVPFGVVDADGGNVVGLTEKPTASWVVSAGIHAMRQSALSHVPLRGRFDMPDLIASIADSGGVIGATPLDQPWMDVGVPQELAKARGELHHG